MSLPAVHDPYAYCPICGVKWNAYGVELARIPMRHRCNPRTLAAIDGAHRRGDDYQMACHEPDLHQRLKLGFQMMKDDEVVEFPGPLIRTPDHRDQRT